MADAFLSYAREDAETVRRIHASMAAGGKKVWVDWEGIPPTAEWMAEIRAAIETADYFVFVISPFSVKSKICRREIDHALSHNKRIVPLLLSPVDEARLHPEVAKLNWISFERDETFEKALADLETAVTADLNYIRAHTRLLVRARDWESNDKDPSLLLRGSDLSRSEALLRADSDPAVTPLQTRFIAAGQRAATSRRRLIGIALVAALLIATGLAAWALVQRSIARENEALAVKRERVARRLQFDSDMKLAFNEWESGRVVEARALLDNHRDHDKLFIWRYLNGLTRADRAVLDVHRAMSVFLSADGRTVFSGGDKTGLQRWDIGSGQVTQLSTAEGLVDSMDMAEDDGLLAWVQKGRAYLLNLRDNKQRELPLRSVETVRFSTDASILGVATDFSTVLWDIASWRQVWKRPYRSMLGAPSIAFIPGTDLLAIGGDDGEIIVWNVELNRLESQLNAPQGRKIYSMAASPDGQYLAAATTSHGHLEIWQVKGWQRQRLADVYHNSPTDGMLAFSPDGRYLASPDGDIVTIWDLHTSRPIKHYRGHNKPISSLSWSADLQHIASGSYDGTVRVWKAIGDQRFEQHQLPIEGHSDDSLIQISSDRRYLLTGTAGLNVFDLNTLEKIATLAHRQPVSRTIFSPNAPNIATITGPYDEQLDWPGPEIFIWDLDTGQQLSKLPIGQGWIGRIRFDGKGRRLNFEVQQENHMAAFFTWDSKTGGVIESQDETNLFSDASLPAAKEVPWADVKNVTVAPAGAGAATWIRNVGIRLWPVSGGVPMQLTSHKAIVAQMAFSPDGQTLASITYGLLNVESPKGELKLWDAETGAELATFLLDGYLRQVGFTADGTILTVAAESGHVFRFPAPYEDLNTPNMGAAQK